VTDRGEDKPHRMHEGKWKLLTNNPARHTWVEGRRKISPRMAQLILGLPSLKESVELVDNWVWRDLAVCSGSCGGMFIRRIGRK